MKKKKIQIKIDNRMRSFGEEDNGKIKINVKKSKKERLDGKPKKDHYAGVLDTIVHEVMHAKHPKKHEKTVYKQTKEKVKHMSRKAKAKYYSMLPR